MKAVALAGWLLADLALILFVVGVADVGPTPTTATTTTTTATTTTPETTTTTEEPTTTVEPGIDPPVAFTLTGVTPDRIQGGDRQAVGDEIDAKLRELGLADRQAALILVFSRWGPTTESSTVLSGLVNDLLEERFAGLTEGAQLRDYGQRGEQGDIKIELFLIR